MKKVIALMLAVLMLATVAFAAQKAPSVTPGHTYTISKDDVKVGNMTLTVKNDAGATFTKSEFKDSLEAFIPRSVNSTNYSVTNTKFKLGKGLVEQIKLNDTNDCVDIIMSDDLNNTKAKSFEASFTLKGKAKYTLKSLAEVDSYNVTQKGDENNSNSSKFIEPREDGLNKKVSLPSLDFELSGTVGYGMVTINIGNDGDEEIESLAAICGTTYEDEDLLDNNIFKFVRRADGGTGVKEWIPSATSTQTVAASAGAYTADAILIQEYGDALTMEARVYHNDKLYFGIDYNPDKPIVKRLADADGDLDFYAFSSDKEYVTFNSNCTLYFNDADEDCFVYKVNDNGYLVPTGNYSEEDGCWIVKTRTLGTYVVSDIELDDKYVASEGDPETTNPDTGANDVVGIAAALAAVALVSAAAVSLKK